MSHQHMSKMFYNCRSLHEIKLPDNISEIGYMAFHSSGITSIELPEIDIST